MKSSVIQRLRESEVWCRSHRVPAYEWLAELLFDAAQELESQSGALWCQWMTGPQSHVRIFVTGEMGRRELESTIKLLSLSLSHIKEDEHAVSIEPNGTPPVAAVPASPDHK